MWSCFSSSAWPTLKSKIVVQTDVNFDMETYLPENSAPMKSSQLLSPGDANLYNISRSIPFGGGGGGSQAVEKGPTRGISL